MQVTIESFKSVRRLSLELGGVTVLVGPPAGGKTNIMEALATLGYAVKAAVEARLGDYPEPGFVPYYNELVRTLSCDDLLWRYTPGSRKARIAVGGAKATLACPDDPSKLDLMLSVKGWEAPVMLQANLAPHGALAAPSELPAPRTITGYSDIERIIVAFMHLASVLGSEAREGRKPYTTMRAPEILQGRVPAPRLYGFDRLGALVYIMYGLTGRRYPYSYLDERGVNLAMILYNNKDILEEVNRIISSISGIRVLPLVDGRLAFIDAEVDVGASSISDTVLRILYGLVALYSNRPASREGLEVTPIVMLEEPEAHMYPIVYDHLADSVVEAAEAGSFVVVSTHSGRLAELLWERARAPVSTHVYYIARAPGSDGYPETIAYKVNMREALVELDDLDSLLTQPHNTIEELAKKGMLERVG